MPHRLAGCDLAVPTRQDELVIFAMVARALIAERWWSRDVVKGVSDSVVECKVVCEIRLQRMIHARCAGLCVARPKFGPCNRDGAKSENDAGCAEKHAEYASVE